MTMRDGAADRPIPLLAGRVGRLAAAIAWLVVMVAGCAKTSKAPAKPSVDTTPAGNETSASDGVGVTALAAGGDTTCALDSAGAVWCWGDVFTGVVDRPVRIEGLPPARQVAVANDHACALSREGAVWCWGRDGIKRAVGDPTKPPQQPILVPELGTVTTIATTGGHLFAGGRSCALNDEGSVHCWQRGGPSWPLGGLSRVSKIAMSRRHACALAQGLISCWTHGAFDFNQGEPKLFRLEGTPPLIDVATDEDNIYGIAEDGRVFGWGLRCGRGRYWKKTTGQPCNIGESRAALRSIDAAGTQLCIARADATRCWTKNQLRERPAYRQVALGFIHGCGLDDRAEVRCWGRRTWGLPGVAPWRPRRYRVPLAGPAAVTSHRVCWLDGQKGARCWSDNGYPKADGPRLTGEWLIGTEKSRSISGHEFTICVGFEDAAPRCTWRESLLEQRQDLRHIALASDGSCAVLTNGGVACRGFGLGEEVTLDDEGLRNVTKLDIGYRHACAMAERGLACWGHGPWKEAREGQARLVTGLGTISDFALGTKGVCVIADGRVACWGNGLYGELGDGLFRSRLEPRFVEGLSGIRRIASGGEHFCAVDTDGSLWCWGQNDYGQLGDGTRQSNGRPLRVPDTGVVTSLALGPRTTCVSRTDDSLCWGGFVGETFGDSYPVEQPSIRVEGIGRPAPPAADAIPTFEIIDIRPTDRPR
jgi:alpha-tubulin suppressor-like RCC1 family protein